MTVLGRLFTLRGRVLSKLFTLRGLEKDEIPHGWQVHTTEVSPQVEEFVISGSDPLPLRREIEKLGLTLAGELVVSVHTTKNVANHRWMVAVVHGGWVQVEVDDNQQLVLPQQVPIPSQVAHARTTSHLQNIQDWQRAVQLVELAMTEAELKSTTPPAQ